MQEKTHSRITPILGYAVTFIVCLLVLCWVMRLWKGDLRVPFGYDGDAVLISTVVKGTIENGWYLHNPHLGMPTGLDMYDFPLPDGFSLILIKLLGLFSSDYGLVINLFYLLTFPLTTLVSLYVMRQLKLSWLSSITWSLLYAFLPFHFMRGGGHLFIATYYFVPLAVLLALRVCEGEFVLPANGEAKRRLGLNWRSPKFILALIFCLLVASVGSGYYAFFSCFFLLIAGITATIYRRNLRHLVVAGIFIAATFSGLLVNLAPNLLYIQKHGRNKEVAVRDEAGAEIYGLKIAQLLLPLSGHRIERLRRLKQTYDEKAPLINENYTATLGFIGSIGFLTLLGWLLFRRARTSEDDPHRTRETLNYLSILNAAGLLLATIGGFASLFALLVSTQIRSYNRISVFIAFFSILAVALLVEEFFRVRLNRTVAVRIAFPAALAILLVLGILDQTNKYFIPDYPKLKAQYEMDDQFVNRIASLMPQDAMIFQLPYIAFPEPPNSNRSGPYDHLRGYLHSKKLRWSYGAMKGREGDQWQRTVAGLQPGEFVEAISRAGFSGIYLDRTGYDDSGTEMESNLSDLLGAKPLVNGNNRLLFYDLTEYNRKLKESNVAPVWKPKRETSAGSDLQIAWAGGFSDLEQLPGETWRWCSSEGELHIENSSGQDKLVAMEMSFSTGYEKFSNLWIESPLFSKHLMIRSGAIPFSQTMVVPPGKHVIKFKCDAQRIHAPEDPRTIIFKVINFRLKP